MSERPIIFSAPMVRAILAGTKTQSRHIVKLPHENPLGRWEVLPWGGPNGGRTRDGQTVSFQDVIGHTRTGEIIGCPHGQPGDRLWVRESWRYRSSASTAEAGLFVHQVEYLADSRRRDSPPMPLDGVGLPKQREAREGESLLEREAYLDRYWRQRRPSIHMPRWASRITLEITGVRIQRLQEINEADAIAEGIRELPGQEGSPSAWWTADAECGPRLHGRTRVQAFRMFWQHTNAEAGWNANPWVWVIEFRKMEAGE